MGAGFAAGTGDTFGEGFTAAGALAGAAFVEALAATGLAAGFFAVNFGFSTFFGLAGFAAARLVGICVSLQARVQKGGRFAGRGIIPANFCVYSAVKTATFQCHLDANQGSSTPCGGVQPGLRLSTTTVV